MITLLIYVNTLNESSYYFVNLKVAGHMHGRGNTVYTFFYLKYFQSRSHSQMQSSQMWSGSHVQVEASVLVNLRRLHYGEHLFQYLYEISVMLIYLNKSICISGQSGF